MAVATSMSFNLAGAFRGLTLASPSSSSSSFFRGDLGSIRVVGPKPSSVRLPLTIQNAHKKGAGSTKNGRDSKGQRLGVKIYGDQVAKPGSIIVRQRGTKVYICILPSTPTYHKKKKKNPSTSWSLLHFQSSSSYFSIRGFTDLSSMGFLIDGNCI